MFTPLVQECKKRNRAMRIGTNHGSLSARTLSFYGDTPRGMVESAIEFADICRANDYHNFVFSMKASNPLVMVQAYRLLAAEQYRLGWDYPLHLGVTEAGEGEDGRMNRAIGIGALLADGLGDTIRVSLTEDPELEHAPCNRLAEIGAGRTEQDGEQGVATQKAVPAYEDPRDVFSFSRRAGELPVQQEDDEKRFPGLDYRGLLVATAPCCPRCALASPRPRSLPSTMSTPSTPLRPRGPRRASPSTPPTHPSPLQVTPADLGNPAALYAELGRKTVVGLPFKDISTTDTLLLRTVPAADDATARQTIKRLQDVAIHMLVPAAELEREPLEGAVALQTLDEALTGALPACAARRVIALRGDETSEQVAKLKSTDHAFIMLDVPPRALADARVAPRLRAAQGAADRQRGDPPLAPAALRQVGARPPGRRWAVPARRWAGCCATAWATACSSSRRRAPTSTWR